MSAPLAPAVQQLDDAVAGLAAALKMPHLTSLLDAEERLAEAVRAVVSVRDISLVEADRDRLRVQLAELRLQVGLCRALGESLNAYCRESIRLMQAGEYSSAGTLRETPAGTTTTIQARA
jgi:hypothetical protein